MSKALSPFERSHTVSCAVLVLFIMSGKQSRKSFLACLSLLAFSISESSASVSGECLADADCPTLTAPEQPIPSPVVVDLATVPAQLLSLAKLSDVESGPGVTRLIFTDSDAAGRAYVRSLMEKAELVVREDAMGNIFGRWVGSEPTLPAVGSGSHADAIPNSGAYDGTLGVLGPIEAIAALKRAGFKPKRSIEVLMFTSEEPTRFGISCVGSRAMASKLDAVYLDSLTDILNPDHGSFRNAALKAGYANNTLNTKDMLSQCSLGDYGAYYDSFIELHIEQGPELEEENLSIGVVTAIAAPAALRCSFTGDGGHAGAQLMHRRNDALIAAAELSSAVEKFALDTKSDDTVATVGVLKVGPGAINSVPRTADMEIDVRDIDGERRDKVVSKIISRGQEIAKKRNVRWSHEIVNADPPATCAPKVANAIEAAAKKLKLSSKRMVSRAYHDSLFMSEVAPTGMLFIPCHKGFSHRPDEFASAIDIKNGVEALALALASLSLA